MRHYTPDVLVYYRTDLPGTEQRRPTLYEVKYRADLQQHWAALLPKFLAARRYAAARGWRFKLVTEREIRTDYLTNVQFLRRYTGPHVSVSQVDQGLLLNLLRASGRATGAELLLLVTTDRTKRAELLYTLWHLVAVGLIAGDLTTPLSLQTVLWIP